MKNITVSVPDDVYHAARVKAAEKGTSVSAVVSMYLAEYCKVDDVRDRGKRLLERMDRIRAERLAAGETGFRMEENLTREGLYDRDALRRH